MSLSYLLFGVLEIWKGINLLQKSLSVLSLSQENIDIRNSIFPVVIFPSNKFETPQSKIWIKVRSSDELQTGDFGQYSVWYAKEGKEGSLLSYYLYFDDLGESGEDKEVKILDREGREIRKFLSIKHKSDILGAYDVKDEKIIPDGDNLLTVLDQEYALSYDFEPSDLVNLSEFEIPMVGGDHVLRALVIGDLKAMMDEALKNGYNLYVLSAYRSYEAQLNLYKTMVYNYSSKEAEVMVAGPGHSEHQLGTAIDFTCGEVLSGSVASFNYTSAAKWLSENAYLYGFTMSYPRRMEALTGYVYEPWHYRYVGVETAQKINESGELPMEYLKRFYFGVY